MLDAAVRAVELVGGRARTDLDTDDVLALALTRLVEVVGEAARRVPEGFRDEHPEIPWRQIVGTRDRLIHGYDSVDLDILWNIVDERLPVLVRQLEDTLGTG